MIENPVLRRELLGRIRSRQPAAVRAAVIGTVLLFVIFCYYEALLYLLRDPDHETVRANWQIAFAIQGFIIWLLCPALAANAVTREKEQQTWEMLIFTLLSPGEILLGKLAARLVPILGILAAFFPFMVLCWARGGATAGEFAITYMVFTVWILFLVMTSLFMSWAFRKTASAIAMSYMVLFVLVIGTGLVEAVLATGQPYLDSPIIWLNPIRIAGAMMTPSDPKGTQIMLLSNLTFIGASAFLFWRMVSRFRDFSVE